MFTRKSLIICQIVDFWWRNKKNEYNECLPNPESSREGRIKRNMLDAPNAVPLSSIWKFSMHSRQFMDAYEQWLSSGMGSKKVSRCASSEHHEWPEKSKHLLSR